MSSFLFASWDGGGNLPPMLTLARRLKARGHRVRVIGDDASAADVAAAGIHFVPWREAPNRRDRTPDADPMRDWEISSPDELLPLLVDRLICGPALAQARDVLAEIRRVATDVVVSSDLILGPLVAAEAAGVGSAILACNLAYVPMPGIPPFGPGFQPARDAEERALHAAVEAGAAAQFAAGLAPLNDARQSLGLPPLAAVFEQIGRADLHLVATAEAFDFPCEDRPHNMRFVGPLLDPPAWAEPWRGAWADPSRPLVLVGFSTTFQDQGAVLQRVIDALSGLAVNAVVTTGPVGAEFDLRASPHVQICESAPHSELLASAALAISHCGHGTVMRSLSAGVPILCLPMGRDQNDNAARVEWHGAGLRLQPSAEVEQIRRAVEALLSDGSYRAAAGRIGAKIRDATDADRAAELLETLVRTKAREQAA